MFFLHSTSNEKAKILLKDAVFFGNLERRIHK